MALLNFIKKFLNVSIYFIWFLFFHFLKICKFLNFMCFFFAFTIIIIFLILGILFLLLIIFSSIEINIIYLHFITVLRNNYFKSIHWLKCYFKIISSLSINKIWFLLKHLIIFFILMLIFYILFLVCNILTIICWPRAI